MYDSVQVDARFVEDFRHFSETLTYSSAMLTFLLDEEAKLGTAFNILSEV